MEQLLHEQLLQTAAACGLCYSRLAALQCQEREDYVQEKERLVVARKPASPFIRKQCLTYPVVCDNLLHTRLLVILLCGQRMSTLEIRACTASPHLLTLFASLPPPSHIAPLQPGTPFLSNLWDSTADSSICLTFLSWTARAKGMWPEHSM